MSRASLLLTLCLACAFATGLIAIVVIQQWRHFPQARVGGSFALVDMTGKMVTQADLRGKPTVFFFGYTSCPDVCPTTLTTLSQVMATMGRAADQLNVVFVTLDPERDTRETLTLYLSSFDPRIRGLTGTVDQTSAMADAYHIVHRRVPSADGRYTMDHSASLLLFDKAGKYSGIVHYGEDEKEMLAKLVTLAQPGTCHPGLAIGDLWSSGVQRQGCGSS